MYLSINYQPSRNDKWWRRNCLSWVGRLVVCLYICTRAYLIDHPFIACTSSVITTQTHTQKERPNYNKVWKCLILIKRSEKDEKLTTKNYELNFERDTNSHNHSKPKIKKKKIANYFSFNYLLGLFNSCPELAEIACFLPSYIK